MSGLDHMCLTAYECAETLETLIRPKPNPLPSGMPKIQQCSLICQPQISSYPEDAGEIWGATIQH